MCIRDRYTPGWTQCTADGCDLNATNTSSWSDLNATERTDRAEYPSALWLVWACLLLLYNGYMFFSLVFSKIGLRKVHSKLYRRRKDPSSTQKYKDPVPTSLDLRLATVDRFPPFGFAVAVFIWFHAHRSWNDYDYNQVTSIVFLLGWTSAFMLLGDTFTWTHKFAKMLKEIIVKDVLLAITATFPYLLTGFSSATHALRSPTTNTTSAAVTPEINLYNVLGSGLTMSQDTDEGDADGKDQVSRLVTCQSLARTAARTAH